MVLLITDPDIIFSFDDFLSSFDIRNSTSDPATVVSPFVSITWKLSTVTPFLQRDICKKLQLRGMCREPAIYYNKGKFIKEN
jgi:hypothetical protein